jgi:endonuclease YncB( thermonuclease family)
VGWPKNNNVFDVKYVRTLDGDTFRCLVELPFYIRTEMDCRLAYINAFELDEPGGEEAQMFLAGILYTAQRISVQSLKPDKYSGRFDGIVTIADTEGHYDLASYLIENGYAVYWDGKGPKPKPAWPRVIAG